MNEFLWVLFVIIKVFTLVEWSVSLEYSPIVKTTKGPVKGQIFTTIRESKRYHAYRGIPYAKPPIGYLRFAAPKEPNAWTEVFDATNESNTCPQIENNKFEGNEDCLQLNVYTPQLPEDGKELKPVMCWIHGGSFRIGQNRKQLFSPDYFIEEDILVVTVNYRLGALGLLALDHENASGNAALKDQNLALRWIQNNIRNFGGDPKKVSLVGQSAGSASVGYQILSKKSKGLFRNTISMSGVPICFWGYDRKIDAKLKSKLIARKLGFEGDPTPNNLLKFYINVNVKNLTEIVNNFSMIDTPLKPVLENSNYTDAFLTECLLKLYKSGDYNHGPLMIGYTKNEAVSFFESNGMIERVINTSLTYIQKLKAEQLFNDIYFKKYYQLYVSEGSIDLSNKSINENIIDLAEKLLTGLGFIGPIDYVQELFSKTSKSDDSIYYYKYDFSYNNSRHKLNGVKLEGAGHGDDIPMIFYSDSYKIDPKANNSVTLLQKRMVRMWANMVKYGNPTPNGTKDKLLDIVWPDLRKSGKMLVLDDELKLNDPFRNDITDLLKYALNVIGDKYFDCDSNYNNYKCDSMYNNNECDMHCKGSNEI